MCRWTSSALIIVVGIVVARLGMISVRLVADLGSDFLKLSAFVIAELVVIRIIAFCRYTTNRTLLFCSAAMTIFLSSGTPTGQFPDRPPHTPLITVTFLGGSSRHSNALTVPLSSRSGRSTGENTFKPLHYCSLRWACASTVFIYTHSRSIFLFHATVHHPTR